MAAQPAQLQENELIKAIADLQDAALNKADNSVDGAGHLPKGYMDSTDSARGGQVEAVLDPGPGSKEDLKPEGHDDKKFDMAGGEGEAAKKSVSKAYDKKKYDKEDESDDDDAEKSLAKNFDARENVKKALEVSRFLSEHTDAEVEAFDNLAKSVRTYRGDVRKAFEDQAEFNGKLAKAVVEVGNQLVDLVKGLNGLANAPVSGPQSVITKSDLDERSFAGEVPNQPKANKVPRSQVMNVLCDWAMKGEVPATVVTNFELTNRLPTKIGQRVRDYFEATAE